MLLHNHSGECRAAMFPDSRGVSPSVMSDITHCKLQVPLKGSV